MEKDNLQDKWNRLANELGLKQNLFIQFLYWYGHPPRAYHTLNHHIEECLNEFKKAEHLAKDRLAIELSIWFHDAIYDSRKTNNEEQSAQLAYQILEEEGLAKSFCQKVADLILATRHLKIPEDIDAQILTDIDLAPLAKPLAEFEENTKKIRKEYDWVPKEFFRKARKKFLQKLLNRPTIYATKFFRDKCEAQARKNLREEIKRLDEE